MPLFSFPCRHLTVHRVLLLSHLLLVISLVSVMSYSSYVNSWQQQLTYFVNSSKKQFTPHLDDISKLLEKRDVKRLMAPSILDYLQRIDNLQFLDILGSPSRASSPVHIRFNRAEATLDEVGVSHKEPHSSVPWVTKQPSGQQEYIFEPEYRRLHLLLALSNPDHGRMWAVFDASQLVAFHQDLVKNLVLEAAAAIFLSMLVALYVTRRIVSPIKELARNMKQAEFASLESFPELTRQDEIGQLAQAYHNLLSKNHEQLRLLQAQNDTDTLTGIGSRHKYSRMAEEFIKRSLGQEKCVGMFVCDIDHFKLYNDFYGHMEGDKALVAVARGIEKVLSPGDQVFRFGGEEFLVLLARPNKDGLRYAGETLRQHIEQLNITHLARGDDQVVTMSVGGAYACLKRMSLDELNPEKVLTLLFEDADKALYQSKRQGRNCFILSNQSIQ
ncbi:diguanylate cyclase [Vibrio sp. AK197]